MIKNPTPSKKTLDFYNKTKKENKPWFEYEDYNFVLITEKSSQIKSLKELLSLISNDS